MKKFTTLLLLLFAFSWRIQAQGQLLEVQFVHNDSLRSYKLYVPAAYPDGESWPLVIVLHGFTLNPDFMIAMAGMNAVADTGHFLVAYPQGLWVYLQAPPIPPFPESGPGWNAGEFLSDNDDVGFLDKMIDKIGLSHQVDPARVYACGLSNGGFMVYRLACELPNRIAAVASVSGGMAETEPCHPGRAVPLMEIHGTADPIVAYAGTPLYLKSIPKGIEFWVKNNHCDTIPVVKQFPDIVPADSTTVVLKQYGHCDAATEVRLYDVLGGGHVWPTSYVPPPPFIGLTNDDIHGSSEIWNFFKQHLHPDPLLTQFPWHAPKMSNPFGLQAPPGSYIRLADFDDDDTTEAILVLAGGSDVKYYENAGSNAAPQFNFVQSYPFGIPKPAGPMNPWQFVDIDGDCDLDIFLIYFKPETPLAYLENKGTPKAPWFGDSSVEYNPFGFVLPTSDSVPGQPLGNAFYTFADIDADSDLDLFFGGHFAQPGAPIPDEQFYFYLNDDPSGNGTSPHFAGPYKNPFNLARPLIPDGIIVPAFVDMDCDGDWDMFATYANTAITYLENTGTPSAPNFNEAAVVWRANEPPAPPGFDSYAFGDWLDIGGDGDMDYMTPSFWMENSTGGAMACLRPLPSCKIISTDQPDRGAGLSLYPSPAGNVLHLIFDLEDHTEGINLEICNLLGQRIMSRKLEEQSSQLNISELQAGMYTLKVSAGRISRTRKFLKL